MPASDLGFHASLLSSQPKCSKLMVIYTLVLLLSLGFTSGQRRSFSHQIDNRSPRYHAALEWLHYINWNVYPGSLEISPKRQAVPPLYYSNGPEIDPFWYVGRGVRPIGRFGKRQLKFRRSSPRSGSSLDLMLNALREQEALEAALEEGGDVW